MKPKTILAISGSLRKHSYNSAVLQALKCLAPAHIKVDIYPQLDELPLFNPDLEDQHILYNELNKLA